MNILNRKSTGRRLVMDVENMSLRSNGALPNQNSVKLKFIMFFLFNRLYVFRNSAHYFMIFHILCDLSHLLVKHVFKPFFVLFYLIILLKSEKRNQL